MSSNRVRAAFSNRTNVSWALPTPPDEHKLKRRALTEEIPNHKRVKLEHEDVAFLHDTVGAQPAKAGRSNCTAFNFLRAAQVRPRRRFQDASLPTRPILATFVSSNKTDAYTLRSEENPLEPGVPFACAFSSDARKGGIPILAVALQEGTIELLNVPKREDWEFEPQRTSIRVHANAIFDVKWGFGDQNLATASSDSTSRITSVSTHRSVAVLAHHKSSVKTLDWDPNHADLLSTASRDGSICVWDLRTTNQGKSSSGLCPVVIIPHAHCDAVPCAKSRSSSKTVTSLLYPPQNPQQLVSSGSFDGVLKQWDLRYPAVGKARKPTLIFESSDPTLHSSKRSRGISSLAFGRNHTAGTLWGLAVDSCIHTYSMPLSAPFPHSAPQNRLTHTSLYVKSFYIKLSTSPCGSWLASGSSGGGVYLWDVGTRQPKSRKAVELKAANKEISAVDWAADSLAACCDDGTVRIWRPNLEVSSICKANGQEQRWDWAWASEEVVDGYKCD